MFALGFFLLFLFIILNGSICCYFFLFLCFNDFFALLILFLRVVFELENINLMCYVNELKIYWLR